MTDASPCSHLQFFGAREFCPDCGLSRTEALVEACAPFLKDDETPAECIVRNRRDVDGCLTMLIDERRKVESLRSRLAEAEQLLKAAVDAWRGDGPPLELDRIDAFLATTDSASLTQEQKP